MAHNHGEYNKAFLIGIILNSIYIIIEFTYGIITDSMSLIADAGHNLSDVLGLVLAWTATLLARKATTKTKTFGYGKSTILAALINALLLLSAIGAITYEAIQRLFEPSVVTGNTIMLVAGVGVIINAVTAFLFFSGQKKDVNIRGAFLHMAADTGVSLGVVIGGFLIMETGYNIIDPILSILIAVIIFIGTWGLLKDSFNLAIDAVPKDINIADVENYLLHFEDVEIIHDLHVWPLSTTQTALSVHIVKENHGSNDEFLNQIEDELEEKFGIEHITVQIERKELNHKNGH